MIYFRISYYRTFVKYILCYRVIYMNSGELTVGISAVANALACNMTNDELLLLASILVQLGDTLVTIATQRDICNKKEV